MAGKEKDDKSKEKALTVLTGDEIERENRRVNKVKHRKINSNFSLSLPPELIAVVISFLCQSLGDFAACSGVNKTWRTAISDLKHVRMVIEKQSKDKGQMMAKFIRANFKQVHALSVCDRRENSVGGRDIELLPCLRRWNIKAFEYVQESSGFCSSLGLLQDATGLETLIIRDVEVGLREIRCIAEILRHQPGLKKLSLVNLELGDEHDDDDEIEICLAMKSLSLQISKMRNLRELSISSSLDDDGLERLDKNCLLGLKDLQHLHLRAFDLETLDFVNRSCTQLKSLHIADVLCVDDDYDSIFVELDCYVTPKHIAEYLQSPVCTIHTLNICSSKVKGTSFVYEYSPITAFDTDDLCTVSDIERICRASKTLRILIATIGLSDEISEDVYVSKAAEASNGRVVLIPGRVWHGVN
mmetsp:Transcript_3571/g.5169  ORF Transcript_3571/g.5169 Transcript_3571/m.5169 type:complete len:414 (-) Transcript_3571:157-1398(-)